MSVKHYRAKGELAAMPADAQMVHVGGNEIIMYCNEALPADKKFKAYLKDTYRNFGFKFSGTHAVSSHPHAAVTRMVHTYRLYKTAASRLRGGGLILDVGGKLSLIKVVAELLNFKARGIRVRILSPILEGDDLFRNQGATNGVVSVNVCKLQDYVVTEDLIMFIHSAYYIPPKDIARAVAQSRLKRGFIHQHSFHTVEAPSGVECYGELTYKVEGDLAKNPIIDAKVGGKSYHHSACKWLNEKVVVLGANSCMAIGLQEIDERSFTSDFEVGWTEHNLTPVQGQMSYEAINLAHYIIPEWANLCLAVFGVNFITSKLLDRVVEEGEVEIVYVPHDLLDAAKQMATISAYNPSSMRMVANRIRAKAQLINFKLQVEHLLAILQNCYANEKNEMWLPFATHSHFSLLEDGAPDSAALGMAKWAGGALFAGIVGLIAVVVIVALWLSRNKIIDLLTSAKEEGLQRARAFLGDKPEPPKSLMQQPMEPHSLTEMVGKTWEQLSAPVDIRTLPYQSGIESNRPVLVPPLESPEKPKDVDAEKISKISVQLEDEKALPKDEHGFVLKDQPRGVVLVGPVSQQLPSVAIQDVFGLEVGLVNRFCQTVEATQLAEIERHCKAYYESKRFACRLAHLTAAIKESETAWLAHLKPSSMLKMHYDVDLGSGASGDFYNLKVAEVKKEKAPAVQLSLGDAPPLCSDLPGYLPSNTPLQLRISKEEFSSKQGTLFRVLPSGDFYIPEEDIKFLAQNPRIYMTTHYVQHCTIGPFIYALSKAEASIVTDILANPLKLTDYGVLNVSSLTPLDLSRLVTQIIELGYTNVASIDRSSFDGKQTVDTAIIDNALYERLGFSKELCQVVKSSFIAPVKSRIGLRFFKQQGRASGASDTSYGNTNLSMVLASLHTPFEAISLCMGDDVLRFSKLQLKTSTIEKEVLKCGFKNKVIVGGIHSATFLSGHFIPAMNGDELLYTFTPLPGKCFSKFMASSSSLALTNPVLMRQILAHAGCLIFSADAILLRFFNRLREKVGSPKADLRNLSKEDLPYYLYSIIQDDPAFTLPKARPDFHLTLEHYQQRYGAQVASKFTDTCETISVDNFVSTFEIPPEMIELDQSI